MISVSLAPPLLCYTQQMTSKSFSLSSLFSAFMSFSNSNPVLGLEFSATETLYTLLASRPFQLWPTIIMTEKKKIYIYKVRFPDPDVGTYTCVGHAALLCWFPLRCKPKTNKYEIGKRSRNGLNVVWCTTDFWLIICTDITVVKGFALIWNNLVEKSL